jgi:hypothetical protein
MASKRRVSGKNTRPQLLLSSLLTLFTEVSDGSDRPLAKKRVNRKKPTARKGAGRIAYGEYMEDIGRQDSQ